MSKHAKDLLGVAIIVSTVFFLLVLWVTDGEKLTMETKTHIAAAYGMTLFVSVLFTHLFSLGDN